jgi:hypothetical protein
VSGAPPVVYGVTNAGFARKPQSAILASLQAGTQGILGNDIDVSDASPLGQWLGIIAEEIAEVWELEEADYNATNRGDAEGALLDNIGDLTGTERLGDEPSTVQCTGSFTLAGTYAIGQLVAYLNPQYGPTSVQFANATAVVVPPTVGGNPIGIGNPFVLDGATNPYALFESTEDGPAYGNALIAANNLIGAGSYGALSEMTPVAGWASVADVATPTLGTLEEDDTPYRVRQYQDLSAAGNDTIDATVAAILLGLQNAVIPLGQPPAVQIYENTSLVTNAQGIPGKSYMVVVYDGQDPSDALLNQDNQIVAEAIWENHPAGIETYGNVAMTVQDSQGVDRTVYFTRPTGELVYLSVTVSAAPGIASAQYPAIASAVQQAILDASQGSSYIAYGQTIAPAASAATTLAPGQDFIINAYRAIAQAQQGVVDVGVMAADVVPDPTATNNIPFTVFQAPYLTEPSVVVTVVPFNPAALAAL